MKKLITTGIVTFLLMLSADNTFAQRDAGGSAGGGTVAVQPCPMEFTRNNGDGTCGGSAQVRLYFSQVPEFAPDLINIYYNGEALLTNPTPITGNIAEVATNGYVSYCLPLSNIPPAVKLTVVFRYNGSAQEDCTISGVN